MLKPNLEQYKDLIRSLFLARVPNLAMVQDNIIIAALNDTAKKYKLKYNLSGANFALECILERSNGVNALDKKHIIEIHKQFGKGSIDELRLATFFRKTFYNRYFNKTENSVPLNFIDYNLHNVFAGVGRVFYYNYYGGKHYESILTRFLQCIIYLLNTNMTREDRIFPHDSIGTNGKGRSC